MIMTMMTNKEWYVTFGLDQMLHVISNWLIALNSATNFFIYCLAGAKFRQVIIIQYNKSHRKKEIQIFEQYINAAMLLEQKM